MGKEEPRILGEKVLCQGRKLALGQVVAEIRGRRVVFDALLHPGAVAILAVDEKGRVLLERQFRPIIGEWIYEVPAGTIEEGENPRETVRRELVEETGYEPGAIEHLVTMYTSPGTSKEKLHIYLAKDLRYRGARPEQDELIETLWIPLDEALEMIKKGEIKDAKTIVALLYYKALYKEHK